MKKVFIGVLAALMLFAFVACDNNAPSVELTNPVVRLYQDEDNVVEYLVNEVPTVDDFVIMAQRADGSVFQVAADDLRIISQNTATAGEDATVASIAYNLGYMVAPVNVKATVYGVEKVEAEYTGSDFDTYYVGYTSTNPEDGRLANDVFHKSQYTVTVTYDTDQTRVLESNEYVVTTIADMATGTAKTATIIVDLNKDGAADSDASTSTATVSNLVIVSDPIRSLAIELAEDVNGDVTEFIAGEDAGTAPTAADFKVTGTYASGKTAVTSNVTLSYITDTLEEGDFPESGTFTVRATAKDNTAIFVEQSFSVTANYVKNFTINNIAGLAPGAVVNATTQTVNWAGTPPANTTYTVVASPSAMPTDAVPGNSYKFVFTLEGHPEADPVVALISCVSGSGTSSTEQ